MRGRTAKSAVVALAILATLAVTSAALFPHLHGAPACQVCLAGSSPVEAHPGPLPGPHTPERVERLPAPRDPYRVAAPPYQSIPSRAPPA